jgi:hypothetical protein
MANTRVTNPVTGFNSATEEGLKLPSGTNANQPSGVQGMLRNDTDETTGSSASAIEHHNGTTWKYFAATESVDNPFFASQNFNTVLYTGNGNTTAQPITGTAFTPDLVWIKTINQATRHILTDSVRDVSSQIFSNETFGPSDYGEFNSFNLDGFTVKRNPSTDYLNQNGIDYVSWNWKGGGAYVDNSDGSITSQVSANVAAGFSIVKYNSGTSAITAGHGLSQAVEMVICKPLVPGAWAIWSKDMATDLDKNYMPLTTSTVVPNASSLWNYSNWGATKIGSSNPLMFGNSNDVICYCWHSVAKYSKIGTYVGNGNATGTIVPLDFEPVWVMIKGVDEASSWLIIDNKRSPTNPASARLDADSGAIEYSGETIMDLNSDGFQLKTASAGKNASGKTFIYMAFAAS